MTEGPSKPTLYKQVHPGYQFVILIVILILAIIIGSFIGIGIVAAKYGLNTFIDISNLKLGSQETQTSLWIIQFTGTTFPILITPLIFSYFVVRDPDNYLKTNIHFPWALIVLVLATMMLANPLIEFLGNINQKMVLPKSLSGLEHWMKDSENSAQKFSDAMMQMHSFGDMLFNLLFIGLLTAIVEESLFRGCLQTIFVRWFKNYHVAIWVTAILFSAFHMEFYGFLPRMLLGVLFGYFVAWSGSIWPAVWGHFVNNGTAVVVTYLYQNKMISLNPDEQQTFNNAGYIISIIITVLLLLLYHYLSKKWQLKHHYGEELD
ncbi:MAG TPA: CPBP family intramembrane glutamic endopeptidase [Mucilaginibacter sp.]|nr:CPBP family intramembrane glutamic endopeptidase [Mucilaginibacter sp.]